MSVSDQDSGPERIWVDIYHSGGGWGDAPSPPECDDVEYVRADICERLVRQAKKSRVVMKAKYLLGTAVILGALMWWRGAALSEYLVTMGVIALTLVGLHFHEKGRA